MSAFLKCFSCNKDNKKKKKLGKCKCRCSSNEDDEMDGKSASKTFSLDKQNIKMSSCYEGDSEPTPETYTSISASSTFASNVIAEEDTFFESYESSHSPGRSYMPVSKDDPFYNMNHPRRGKAIIFNFDRWDNTNIPNLGLTPRQGSEKDKSDLSNCLRSLDFEIQQHDNVTYGAMKKIFKKVRLEDHSNADCLVVVVMTHGEKNTVYMADGTQVPINLIWSKFEANKCPSLAGKPKIFIVQACRGTQYDSGTTLEKPNIFAETREPRMDVTDSSAFSYVIPNAADIIVAFSCPLGHYSWRHPERGSWFIQSICKVFTQHAYDMDLQSLFTYVAREVAVNYSSSTTNFESNNKKQVTSTSSTLIRSVMFKPKIRLEDSALALAIAHDIGVIDTAGSLLPILRSAIELRGLDSDSVVPIPEEAAITGISLELCTAQIGTETGENSLLVI